MEMIRNTAHAQRFCVQVTANCGKVGVHAWTHVAVKPWFTILRAKDNVNDDPAKGLWHRGIIAEKDAQVNGAFSADGFLFTRTLGRCPRLAMRRRLWREYKPKEDAKRQVRAGLFSAQCLNRQSEQSQPSNVSTLAMSSAKIAEAYS